MLTVIIGPMKSGKTESMILKIKREQYNGGTSIPNKYICYIHSMDKNRFDNKEGCLKSRSDVKIKAIALNNILDAHWKGYDIIGIDEGHFWDPVNLVSTVKTMLSHGKKIYITMLNSDYRRESFPALAPLIALGAIVKTRSSFCCYEGCGKPAFVTASRIDFKNKPIIVSDADKIFEPRCFDHYIQYPQSKPHDKCVLIYSDNNISKNAVVDILLRKYYGKIHHTALAELTHELTDYLRSSMRDIFGPIVWCKLAYENYVENDDKGKILLVSDCVGLEDIAYFDSKFNTIHTILVYDDENPTPLVAKKIQFKTVIKYKRSSYQNLNTQATKIEL